jgi:hypothetical protein
MDLAGRNAYCDRTEDGFGDGDRTFAGPYVVSVVVIGPKGEARQPAGGVHLGR